MDQNERQPENKVTIDRDAQINVTLNAPNTEEDSIDLGRVFHNMKVKRRVFAWVLVLCLVVGVCAPLAIYPFTKPSAVVSAVVTLKYDVPMVKRVNEETKKEEVISLAEYKAELLEKGETESEKEPEIIMMSVSDLTAPDGEELDLSQITSAYVLSQALVGLELSQPISAANLRSNITVERILTEESSQTQEMLSQMTADKTAELYQQLQNSELQYDNKFVVRLQNGFMDEDSGKKLSLTDSELQLLLERVLDAYNSYLVRSYAEQSHPVDGFSLIREEEGLELLDALERMQEASYSLYAFCNEQSDEVKAWRSSRDGRNLNDWMKIIRTQREAGIDYLYSNVYANNIVENSAKMLATYQYQLRNAKAEKKALLERINSVQVVLDDYKNDEVYVSVQESDSGRSTLVATEGYNKMVLLQADNYTQLAKLEQQIAGLNEKITSLSGRQAAASAETAAETRQKLDDALDVCIDIYNAIDAHMEELRSTTAYTTYAEHTVAQATAENFLAANLKKMLIGAGIGAVLACGMWFIAALAPEFRRNRKEDDDPKAGADGKEAVQA